MKDDVLLMENENDDDGAHQNVKMTIDISNDQWLFLQPLQHAETNDASIVSVVVFHS